MASSSQLPPFIRGQARIQASSAIALGIALLTLPPEQTLANPIASSIATHILRQSPPNLILYHDSAVLQLAALLGLFSLAIGAAYGLSLFYGYDHWLYLSIPARLMVGLVGIVVAVLAPEKMSPLMFVVCVNDGVVGLLGGALMGGDWSGRMPKSASKDL